LAVEKGCEKVVKLLLECGANVDAEVKDCKTVLHFAVENGCSVTKINSKR
jgi:ankyrin repeat protein